MNRKMERQFKDNFIELTNILWRSSRKQNCQEFDRFDYNIIKWEPTIDYLLG